MTRHVYAEIRMERERQDAKWGGPEHDDDHDWIDWIDYIKEHAGKGYSADDSAETRATFRRRMIEVGALAVAAVESLDRNWSGG